MNLGGRWAPTVLEMAQLVRDRCSAVLDFAPELTRATEQPGETPEQLEYSTQSMGKSGFIPCFERADEIDRLLVFCGQAFAPSR